VVPKYKTRRKQVMENVQKIAEEVLEELSKESIQNADNGKMLQGAMQGVRLLFQKLAAAQQEAVVEDEQHSKPGGKAPGKK